MMKFPNDISPLTKQCRSIYFADEHTAHSFLMYTYLGITEIGSTWPISNSFTYDGVIGWSLA